MDLPQFDTTTFTSQVFWLLLCSLVLLLFIKNVFVPRVVSIMNARDKRIFGDTARAQDIRGATQKLQSDYDEKVKLNRMNASQQQQSKLAEFDVMKAERMLQIQKVFSRKRLALEKKGSMDLHVNNSFVDVLLHRC
ncbi:MAG: hypothetical protein LBQ43_04875 [Holosporales bacterium]|jgi:F-type H+-transporting ATPase subunit b|nr:hypothetical protein [Holosporales bacterium]